MVEFDVCHKGHFIAASDKNGACLFRVSNSATNSIPLAKYLALLPLN